MKHAILLLAIFLTGIHNPAKATRTDFENQLAQAPTDSQKLNIYRSIYDHYKTAKSDSAKTYVERGLAEFAEKGYRHGVGVLLMLLSNIYNERGMLVLARTKGLEALDIFTALREEVFTAKANTAIGSAESYLGNYPDAFRHFLAALKSFELVADTAGLINTYLELGAANDFNKNHEKALGFYNKALDLSLGTKESASIVYLYNNIGLSHARKGDLKEALKYFQKAELISRKPEYVKARFPPLTNLGKLYMANGDNTKALEYLYEAMNLAKKLGTPEPLCRVLLEIGRIESRAAPAHISSLEEGLKIAGEIDSKRLQSEFLIALADAADKTGDYKQEVIFLKQATALRDSVFNMDKAKEIANLQSEYELKRTSAQLADLEKQEFRNRQRKNVVVLVAGILTLTLLTLMVFYTRSRRLNKELSARERDLKKANNVKDRLFSIIGHDLKGPVGNIPSLLTLYKNEDNTEDERAYILRAMEESSQASLETLDKLLNWGKQQIKGNLFNPSTLDVDEIMNHNIRLLSVAAANKNITIVNHVSPSASVYADENQFKFVIRNLISNAVKFTHSGGTVEIAAARQPDEEFVVFSVKDNGIGISDDLLEHIFDPYSESTRGTANEAGTGIGLMLCREFVAQNGGKLWVQSVKGQGATFSFTVKGGLKEA